jgi:hypothetical protein
MGLQLLRPDRKDETYRNGNLGGFGQRIESVGPVRWTGLAWLSEAVGRHVRDAIHGQATCPKTALAWSAGPRLGDKYAAPMYRYVRETAGAGVPVTVTCRVQGSRGSRGSPPAGEGAGRFCDREFAPEGPRGMGAR